MPRKKKSNAGRPTLDTPETRQKIYDIVKQCGNVNTAARILGMSKETIRLWKEDKPDFLALCQEALGRWELTQLLHVQKEKGGSRWLLRNRIPQEYKEQVQVEVGPQGILTIESADGSAKKDFDV